MRPSASVQALAAFLSGTWERAPAVLKATPERRAFFGGLASFSELARVARICEEEGEPLEFGEGGGGASGSEGGHWAAARPGLCREARGPGCASAPFERCSGTGAAAGQSGALAL